VIGEVGKGSLVARSAFFSEGKFWTFSVIGPVCPFHG